MMRKQSTLDKMKTFKSELLLDGQAKSKDAKPNPKKLERAHSVAPAIKQQQQQQQSMQMDPERVSGDVTFKDIRNYLSFSLGMCGLILYFVACLASGFCQLSIGLFLAKWAKEPLEEQQDKKYPRMMFILINASVLLAFTRELTIFTIVIKSNTNMHNKMTEMIARAKTAFYDANPTGRILTRFSKDMALLDIFMPSALVLVSYGIFRTIVTVISLCIINPWLLIPLFLSFSYFIYTVMRAAQIMVEAQRLDGVVRGPIHQLFTMLGDGLVTMRAYDKVKFFKTQFINESDMSANVSFSYYSTNRWLGFRFDMAVMFMSIVTVITCVMFKGRIEEELLTFSLQVITDLTVFFSIAVRLAAEMQNFMTSAQRIHSYTELESEDALKKERDE